VSRYQPPYTLTGAIVSLVADIGELLGRFEALQERSPLRLRRVNRIRTIAGSLAIEGNTLSEAQITAILDGKAVIAPPREILEARNALAVYEALPRWNPQAEADLLAAHRQLMQGLIDSAGYYRNGGVGVMAGQQVLHMAPPASQVHRLMHELFAWLGTCSEHPLIVSSVFHYEFEFIHPFADGNGRMGRLWQTLLLSRWRPRLAHLPVESLVHRHQAEYYAALQAGNDRSNSAPFIEFMLRMIRDVLQENLSPQAGHQDAPQASPQVIALLRILDRERSRAELQAALGLADRKSFRQRYLQAALDGGWITPTRPDQPSSPAQRYRRSELAERLLAERADRGTGEIL
jgi:Fic family protein